MNDFGLIIKGDGCHGRNCTFCSPTPSKCAKQSEGAEAPTRFIVGNSFTYCHCGISGVLPFQ